MEAEGTHTCKEVVQESMEEGVAIGICMERAGAEETRTCRVVEAEIRICTEGSRTYTEAGSRVCAHCDSTCCT